MTVNIALLRGINVGGKNIIKMAELKKAFETLGFKEVKTYIQSGNVLFKSDETEQALQYIIEHEIEAVFGLSVNVVLRTSEELEQIILNYPFPKDEVVKAELSTDAVAQYVALLRNNSDSEKLQLLDAYAGENDQYRAIGREIYLLFHHSIRDSNLANNLNKLDVPATVRNWKTISKLAEMAKSMEN